MGKTVPYSSVPTVCGGSAGVERPDVGKCNP